MRITDLLDARSVSLTSSPKTKSEALDQAVALMTKSGKINDEEAYRSQVYAREEESTTGIGEGIAIPHGKCDAVSRPGLAAMVIKNGVDFDSLDGEPVTLLFLIAAPNTKDNVHLDVLSKLSVMLMDEEFTENLRNASSVEEFLRIIDQADEEKASIDERLEQTSILDEPSENKAEPVKKILAVTSCPTGIAHTYMAAEGLEKAAKKLGCRIKIETRGSGGAKNVLTQAEIDEADCIIVAADAKVPMERFNGKKVIQPEQLQELDTTELVQLIAKGKNNKNESVQKYRDILKAAVIMEDENADYLLLGIENQTEHEMMDFPLEEMRTFIQDYKIHLIDPAALEPDELEKFSTSLREVLGCIKYSKDKEKLSSFIRNNTRMMLEINAARVIQAITNITLDLSEEVEEVDMCKALNVFYVKRF